MRRTAKLPGRVLRSLEVYTGYADGEIDRDLFDFATRACLRGRPTL